MSLTQVCTLKLPKLEVWTARASSSKGTMEEYMRCGLIIFITQWASTIYAYFFIFQSKESGNAIL